MQFWLDDIDRAGQRIALVSKIRQGAGNGHKRIHDAFGNLFAIRHGDRRIGHEMPDIAHQHQCPSTQLFLLAIRGNIGFVTMQLAGQ